MRSLKSKIDCSNPFASFDRSSNCTSQNQKCNKGLLQALIPIATLAPLVPSLLDTGGGFQAMIVQLRELWDLVQRRTVWWPMSFVFVVTKCLSVHADIKSSCVQTKIKINHTKIEFCNVPRFCFSTQRFKFPIRCGRTTSLKALASAILNLALLLLPRLCSVG